MSEQEKKWEEELKDWIALNWNTENPVNLKSAYLQACKVRQEEINQWREFTWINHGCPVSWLYGDDGEKQCNNIESHPPIDFKRDSVDDIIDKLRPDALAIREIMRRTGRQNEGD